MSTIYLLRVTLENGMVLEYPVHLDSGGSTHRYDFAKVLAKYGKSQYSHAFEWCAGAGFIGYDLMARGFYNKISFSDYYDVAIQQCLSTADKNNLSNNVVGYVTPVISNIPITVKWDLVVANPPHVFDEENFIKFHRQENPNDPLFENVLRLIIDQDFDIHREFFTNISSRLEPDADLFISENGIHSEIIDMAKQGGLTFKDAYNCDYFENGYILHFRYI